MARYALVPTDLKDQLQKVTDKGIEIAVPIKGVGFEDLTDWAQEQVVGNGGGVLYSRDRGNVQFIDPPTA